MPRTKKRQPPSMNPPRTPLTLKKPKLSKWQKILQKNIDQNVVNVQNRLDIDKDLPNLRNFLEYIYRSIRWSYQRLSDQKIFDKWYEVIRPYLEIIKWQNYGHAGSANTWNDELKTLCKKIFPLAEWQEYPCKTEKIKEFEYKKIFDLPYLPDFPDFPSFQGGKKKTRKTNKKARKSHKKTKKAKRK